MHLIIALIIISQSCAATHAYNDDEPIIIRRKARRKSLVRRKFVILEEQGFSSAQSGSGNNIEIIKSRHGQTDTSGISNLSNSLRKTPQKIQKISPPKKISKKASLTNKRITAKKQNNNKAKSNGIKLTNNKNIKANPQEDIFAEENWSDFAQESAMEATESFEVKAVLRNR